MRTGQVLKNNKTKSFIKTDPSCYQLILVVRFIYQFLQTIILLLNNWYCCCCCYCCSSFVYLFLHLTNNWMVDVMKKYLNECFNCKISQRRRVKRNWQKMLLNKKKICKRIMFLSVASSFENIIKILMKICNIWPNHFLYFLYFFFSLKSNY